MNVPESAAEKPKAPEFAGGKSRGKTILLVCALMLVEGVAIYFAVDYLSVDPAAAAAEAVAQTGEHGGGHEGTVEGGQPAGGGTAEWEIADCRPTNNREGRLYQYSIRVSVLVREENLERLKALAEQRRSRVDDRVSTVIRSAEPKQLNEPGLETLKRQLKAELSTVFDDPELVLEVFIPELIRSTGGL